jgi:hypothetical protein
VYFFSNKVWLSSELTGEADLPPSGAGHRGRPRLPLIPWACSRASPIRVALARARFGHWEPLPEAAPAEHRRTPLHRSQFRCAHRRAPHARVLGRWILHGRIWSERGVPLWCGPPWTRAPGSRRGPPQPRPYGSKIHGWIKLISFKSPWVSMNLHAGPSTC